MKITAAMLANYLLTQVDPAHTEVVLKFTDPTFDNQTMIALDDALNDIATEPERYEDGQS